VFRGAGSAPVVVMDSAGSFSFFNRGPTISNAGVIVSSASLDSGESGIFANNGSANSTIALTNGPEGFTGMGPYAPINDSGKIALPAAKTVFIPPFFFTTTLSVHLRDSAGNSTTIWTDANAAGVAAPSVNNHDDLVFTAQFGSDYRILRGSGGPVTTYLDTATSPYSIFSDSFINDNGVIVFSAQLDGSSQQGVYYGPDPVNNKIIQFGDPLFGSTVSDWFFFRGINNKDEVAFQYLLANGVNGIAVVQIPSSVGTVTNSTWNVDASGSWSVASNWTDGIPNAVDATAIFGSIITASRTVTVDSPQTVGVINFDSTNSYTVSGASAITMDVSSGPAAINVLSGSHIISAPTVLNDDLTINSAGSGVALTGNLTATGKTITKIGAGSVEFENVRAAALLVNAGSAKISLKGTPNSAAGTTIVGSLSLSPGAELDLTNNSMIVDYIGAVGTLVEDIREHLANNRLSSSSASATLGLGYGDNGLLGNSIFAGQAVDASSLLIKFTYLGDTDLDGVVDVADLGKLATNWQAAGVWTTGDFDYSGLIDVNDLGMLATNWQAGVGNPLEPAFSVAIASLGLPSIAVPEPTLVGLLSIATTAVQLRRRRRLPVLAFALHSACRSLFCWREPSTAAMAGIVRNSLDGTERA
jgi:hypothetical protein